MRIGAVGDLHGEENLESFLSDLDRLPKVDLFLLAGDTTDRNDLEAFETALEAIRARIDVPLWIVFGNNEYAHDHPTYIARFRDRFQVRFLEDEAAVFDAGGTRLRIVGSTGCLDRPTYWQRTHLPHMEAEYRNRMVVLDQLLEGDEARMLLTHYPPTYATMGGEKDAWRPELGCKALEPVLLRRRPTLVIHGHIHKGIPFAELRPSRVTLDSFAERDTAIPVHNVAYPARKGIGLFDV